MDVNYLVEINGLDDWEMGNPLSATAYKVMRKLLMLANRKRFPEQIAVTNTSLCFLVGCSENSLLDARQQLIQRGLIDYKGKKKQTPVYTIHYFSLNPDYNRKNCGYIGDMSGDMSGYSQGFDGGIGRGRYINNIHENGPDQAMDEDCATANIGGAENDRSVHTPLPFPSPIHPSVDVVSPARVFPPRSRRLDGEEWTDYKVAKAFLSQIPVAAMYGREYALIQQLAESDYYPIALVCYAMDKTVRRNGMYPTPLDNPAAYTIKLLDDWKRNGFRTREDVQEAKDDWMHYG